MEESKRSKKHEKSERAAAAERLTEIKGKAEALER